MDKRKYHRTLTRHGKWSYVFFFSARVHFYKSLLMLQNFLASLPFYFHLSLLFLFYSPFPLCCASLVILLTLCLSSSFSPLIIIFLVHPPNSSPVHSSNSSVSPVYPPFFLPCHSFLISYHVSQFKKKKNPVRYLYPQCLEDDLRLKDTYLHQSLQTVLAF